MFSLARQHRNEHAMRHPAEDTIQHYGKITAEDGEY